MLLELLRRYLTLGAEGEGEPVDPADPGDPGDPGDTLDDLLDTVEASTLGKPAKTTEEDERITAANRRAEEAERRAQQAEERARQAIPAQPPRPDPEFEAEERRLAEAKARGADENTLSWLNWQIGNDRKQREAIKRADQTLAASIDIADRADFKADTDPDEYRMYAKRVEETIQGFRRNGQTVPTRSMVLTFLMGQDKREQNKKVKARPKPAPSAPAIDRGRLPNSRSDVRRGSGAMTNKQKLEERLKDRNI